jgi:probable HAF family extracellular repeat protein
MKGIVCIAGAVAVAWCGGVARAASSPPVYHVTYLGFSLSSGGLNNHGQVVGSNGGNGFIYDGGSVTTLGSLGGTSGGLPAAINDAGQVVGSALTVDNVSHAFLYAEGSMTDLGVLPGYPESSASRINAAGDVVGTSFTQDGGTARAFLYQDGTLTDLGPGRASGINASGAIVGTSQNNRAVLYQNGAVVDLGDFGDSVLTSANDINDAGQIVGTSYVRRADNQYVNHPFLYESGVWRDLGLPAGVPLGLPRAINNVGQVVGNSNGSLGSIDRPPFLYMDGAIYNMDSLLDSSGAGLWLELAYDINDSGVILAEGMAQTETYSGYQAVLLTPAPEPGALALSGLVAGGILGVSRRRRG